MTAEEMRSLPSRCQQAGATVPTSPVRLSHQRLEASCPGPAQSRWVGDRGGAQAVSGAARTR